MVFGGEEEPQWVWMPASCEADGKVMTSHLHWSIQTPSWRRVSLHPGRMRGGSPFHTVWSPRVGRPVWCHDSTEQDTSGPLLRSKIWAGNEKPCKELVESSNVCNSSVRCWCAANNKDKCNTGKMQVNLVTFFRFLLMVALSLSRTALISWLPMYMALAGKRRVMTSLDIHTGLFLRVAEAEFITAEQTDCSASGWVCFLHKILYALRWWCRKLISFLAMLCCRCGIYTAGTAANRRSV